MTKFDKKMAIKFPELCMKKIHGNGTKIKIMMDREIYDYVRVKVIMSSLFENRIYDSRRIHNRKIDPVVRNAKRIILNAMMIQYVRENYDEIVFRLL